MEKDSKGSKRMMATENNTNYGKQNKKAKNASHKLKMIMKQNNKNK